MARIESVAKAGYYPTPQRITETLCEALTRPFHRRRAKTGARIIDPCCGLGEAAAALAQKAADLDMVPATYGIELSQQRARAARAVLGDVMHADYFHTTIARDAFDIVFLNPPYDLESEHDGVRRSETAFLKRSVHHLKKVTGLLVYIIPRHALADSASTLSREFKGIHVLSFPEPEVQNFNQVVVTATRKPDPFPDPDTTEYLRQVAWDMEEPPCITDPPEKWRIALPAEGHDPGPVLFASQRIDLNAALSEVNKSGILAAPSVAERFWPTGQTHTRPALPLRQGHIALMTAAGFLDNQVLPGQNGQDPIIIKGRTYKESVVTASTKTSSTDTEVMRTTIRSLNLTTGERRDIKP